MAPRRRIGAPDAKNRTVLLDAAEQLMLEEGYAAVTSRRVAAKAGLKPQLVHYYFRTMDELFLANLQRRADEGLKRLEQVLASPQPLRALWEWSTDPAGTSLTAEFIALSNHRKTIRAEIARIAERFRAAQLEAMTSVLERYGVDSEAFPPAAVLLIMTSISRIVVIEEALGMSTGHAETLALVERQLERFEGPPRTEPEDQRPSR